MQQARFYSYGSDVRNDTYLTSNDSSWYVPLQVGPQAGISSVPITAAGLATAGSGNAGSTWVEMLQQPEIHVNLSDPIINKAATRFYRRASFLYVGGSPIMLCSMLLFLSRLLFVVWLLPPCFLLPFQTVLDADFTAASDRKSRRSDSSTPYQAAGCGNSLLLHLLNAGNLDMPA